MRKLILAIVALVCVDMGFVGYMSVNNADIALNYANALGKRTGLVANSPNNLTGSPRIADNLTASGPDAASTPVTPEEIVPVPANQRHANRIDRSAVGRRSYIAKLHLRGIKKDRMAPAPIEFRTTTILYAVRAPVEVKSDKEFAGYVPAERRSDLAAQTVKTRPRFENRSLIARAMPIIKKPYDWIKAVGSRLF